MHNPEEVQNQLNFILTWVESIVLMYVESPYKCNVKPKIYK